MTNINAEKFSFPKSGILLGLTLWIGLFISCNTEPEIEHRVNLFLQDSLSKDRGNYDSLHIDIVSTTGSMIQPLVFTGAYLAEPTDGVLKGLLLGAAVPPEFDISIKAFHKNGDTVSIKITVKDKEAGAVVRLDSAKTGAPTPKSLSLSDSIINLGLTSNPHQVSAVLQPAGVSGLIRFQTLDSTIATVDSNGFITPVALGDAKIIASVIGHSHVADTLLVNVIRLNAITEVKFTRPAPSLYSGAPGKRLQVSHSPDSLTPVLEFHSSAEEIITVSSNGTVSAKAEGSAIITVSLLGSTSVTDTIMVQALRDAPIIDAGTSQGVAVGQPVTIKVKVTQAYGTLNLSWDFTEDNVPEGQTTSDSALATHTYASQGDYTAVFTAKDGEGNTTTQSVRIRVGKAGPLVIITRPRQDTLVNTPNFTVHYASDSSAKTQGFTLIEGLNVLTVRDSNATGKDSASIRVRLDTKTPIVKVTAPRNALITNQPEVDVAWTVDSVLQGSWNKENLVGKQGSIGIVRTFTDSAGNVGRDSITITRDTIAPSAPVFTGRDTATNSKRPTWSWTSGGGGSGIFAVQWGNDEAKEDTALNFRPLADLNDAAYTVRVRERDAAGNWSGWASRTITVKTSPPSAPSFNTALTTTSPTQNKQPTWAWVTSGVIGGGSGNFRWSVTTPTPVADSGTATNFTPSQDLPDGTYTLTLQERDALGNWSTAITRDIRILTEGALVEITSPARSSYTNLKNGVIAVAWEVNGAAQNEQLTHTLTTEGAWNLIRREYRDSGDKVSFDTLSVYWDTTSPAIPTVSASTSSPTTDQTPTWSWTGTGNFEYRYGTTNPPTTNVTAVNGVNSFTPASDLALGTWYFQVRAGDRAGNWSAWSSVHTMVIELPQPSPYMPAARQHVRTVNGVTYKYTSKLRKIIELNFTFGFGHAEGKPIIAAALDRIALNYSRAGSSISVQHFTGSNGGTSTGGLPSFSTADLLSGQVIVANNISQFGDVGLGAQRQTSIQTAIEVEGRGYIGIHGSGDNERTGWPWYTNTLHPVQYQGHGTRVNAPVYKHLDQAKHVVLQGVLDTGTTLASNVPDEVDAGGNEKLSANIPVRQMKGEWHRYGRDISRDPQFQNLVTPLLKYDARSLSTTDFPTQFRRPGGNLFTYIYQVGKGKTSYLPPGHANDELLDPTTGFDGGVGDWDRYLAQLMFYLAGYDSTVCDASCNGLYLVNEKQQLVTSISSGASEESRGIGVISKGVYLYSNQVAFALAQSARFKAVVTDYSGHVFDQIEGHGMIHHVFDTKSLKSGVYFLKVSVGNKQVRTMRYAIL